jgi:nucleoside phosphorylase
MPPVTREFDDKDAFVVSKRRKLEQGNEYTCAPSPVVAATFSYDDYTVGWISALPLEMAAAKAMLDAIHPPLPNPPNDSNSYTLGQLGAHNVVIACMPSGVYGMISAATVATQMLSSFPSIRFGLMVGIGGGASNAHADIRLGDVVVSKPSGDFGGVVQYDYGKTVQEGCFKRTGTLNKPPPVLLTAISNLQADHSMRSSRIPEYLSEMAAKHLTMASKFARPPRQPDRLFEVDYEHTESERTCDKCDSRRLVNRAPRSGNCPVIHYGLIASANQVMKHANTRDRLARELGILCFEMEAGGLMDCFPCLIIRGICDYADSHKNKQWQNYAAATAAAYGKELLSVVPIYQNHATNPAALLRENMCALSFEHCLSQQLMQLSLDKISNEILRAMQDYSEVIKSRVLDMSQNFIAARDQGSLSDHMLTGEKSSLRKRPELADKMPPIGLRKQQAQRRKRLLRFRGESSWFGKIMISVLEIYTGDDLTHILTEWLFIPSPWLFRLRRGFKILYLKSIVARESPKFTLRPIQILPGHSPIICSIESHDIEAAIQMLRQKTVNPSAVTMDGKSLLNLVSNEVFNTAFGLLVQSGEWYPVSHGLPAYSAEKIEQEKNVFSSLQALYSYLLAQGVDPAQRCVDGA